MIVIPAQAESRDVAVQEQEQNQKTERNATSDKPEQLRVA